MRRYKIYPITNTNFPLVGSGTIITIMKNGIKHNICSRRTYDSVDEAVNVCNEWKSLIFGSTTRWKKYFTKFAIIDRALYSDLDVLYCKNDNDFNRIAEKIIHCI